MMADSQPLSGAPEGAEYLRAVLRAPGYEAAQVTPLQKMEKLSSRLDNVILVKREDRQPVHSFKLRGAYAMMAGLTEEQKAHGVITASAGNHAQGVAFSSARLGVKALIVIRIQHSRPGSAAGTFPAGNPFIEREPQYLSGAAGDKRREQGNPGIAQRRSGYGALPPHPYPRP